MRAWRLDDGRQTLVLAVDGPGAPHVAYWGAALPPDEDTAAVARAAVIDLSIGGLDRVPPLSLLPDPVLGFQGQPGLVVRDADGAPMAPRFGEVEADMEGPLAIRFRMQAGDLSWWGRLALDPDTTVLEASAGIETAAPVWLEWLAAPVLPVPLGMDRITDFAGRWNGEFQEVTTAITPGMRLRENRTGRTSHEHFPGAVLGGPATGVVRGPALGLHYGWSGGHAMLVEELACGRRQVQFGHARGSERRPGRAFATGTLYAALSTEGTNGVARAFQRHARDRVMPVPRQPRPVHLNSWEAVYFDHDLDDLLDLARAGRDLGAERFVLDDGWFRGRQDDTRALGDWTPDPVKWPDGLAPLIDGIGALGMSFGLWVEPEMISEDSDLFRAHPDWVLGPAEQVRGRGQMVLDLSRDDVRDHLFTALDALLAGGRIGYLKWDHNRPVPFADAAQARGVHELIDRIRAAHQGLEIESCAGGGGRIDFGILSRTDRVWLSDSNDALERVRMQRAAAIFLPGFAVGSHTGANPSHTSARRLDAGFRAWVAAMRHMGLELDPRRLTPQEAQAIREVVAWWRATRDWRAQAVTLGLETGDPSLSAEIDVAEDGSRFVVFAARIAAAPQTVPRPLPLTGIAADRRWRVGLRAAGGPPTLSRGAAALSHGPIEVSGAWLLSHGPVLPVTFPERMLVIEGEAL